MKRIAVWILILSVVLSVCTPASWAQSAAAKMTEFYGSVQVKRAASEKAIAAFKQMRVDEGDAIITGKDSKAVLQLDGGKTVTVAANTHVTLSELKAGNVTTFSIQSGGVGSKLDQKLDENAKYRIKTPTAVMGVRGTEFYVQVERDKNKPKVNATVGIWLAEGTVVVNYRAEEGKLQQLSENRGKPEQIIMTAPAKFELPESGKVKETPEKFEIRGLYKEFLEDDVLKEIISEDELKEEKTRQESEEKEEKEEKPVVKNPTWTDVVIDDEEENNDNEDVVSIPSRPPGNYVYIGRYRFDVNAHPVEGVINDWVSYQLEAGSSCRVDMGEVTDNQLLDGVIFRFTMDDATARDFIYYTIP